MFQDVEQVATLDVEDNVFEPDAAIRPELRVLRVVPVEVLHLEVFDLPNQWVPSGTNLGRIL